MKKKTYPPKRLAYSLAETAALMGRHRSWAYRQRDKGLLRSIKGYGREFVPVSEIERILEGADDTKEQRR